MPHLKRTRELIEEWASTMPERVADVLMALAKNLTVNQRNALKNRIRDDIKTRNTRQTQRASASDVEADDFNLDEH